MTVRALIDKLENYDEDMEVVLRGSHTMYVDSIGAIGTNEVRAFYGNDWEAVVLYSDQQVGAV